MEKRITALRGEPHTVSLADRECSLFIDPKSACIFVDEGEGDGRMNGAVFTPGNGPFFLLRPTAGLNHRLILDYCGTQYFVGVSEDIDALERWTDSANALLAQKRRKANTSDHEESKTLNVVPRDAARLNPVS